MTLYLDTSALVKLLTVETETGALRAYLLERPGERRATSSLARTELRRAARRIDGTLLPAAERLLTGLWLVRVSDDLLDTAGRIGPALVRSLDAIHLGSALRLAPLTAFVTYDSRMADGAAALGLPVAAPS